MCSQASKGTAKVLGLIADKPDCRLKRIDEMTDDELDNVLGNADCGARVH